MADGLKENYDEEVCAKDNLARQLNKALGDADMWKQKYEIDGVAKAEELEMARLKLQARLSEGQAVVEQLSLKLAQLEKAKSKTSADVTEMAQLLDQAQIMQSAMEKKAKQFDRLFFLQQGSFLWLRKSFHKQTGCTLNYTCVH